MQIILCFTFGSLRECNYTERLFVAYDFVLDNSFTVQFTRGTAKRHHNFMRQYYMKDHPVQYYISTQSRAEFFHLFVTIICQIGTATKPLEIRTEQLILLHV